MRSPVYVLVTKADLIAGFNESFGDARTRRSATRSGASPSRYAPTSSRRPAGQLRLRVRRAREAPARPAGRPPAWTPSATCSKRAAHLRLPAAVRRPARPARRLPRAGVRAGGTFEAAAAAARRLLHQRHAGRHADRPRARHAVAHLRRRARALPPPAAARGKSFFLQPPAQGRGLRRAGPGRREPGDGAPARARCASPASRSCCSLSVGLLAGWAVSYTRNKSYIAEVEAEAARPASKTVDALPPRDLRRRHAAAAGADRGAHRGAAAELRDRRRRRAR